MAILALAVAALMAPSPPACSSPGWNALEALSGDWQVSFSFRTSPGHFEKGAASSNVTRASTPCTLVDQVEGKLAGKPISFLSVITLKADGTVERAYMDSEHGRLIHYTGSLERTAATLTMDYPANSKFGSRAELDMSNPHEPRVTHFLSTDRGRSWQPVLMFHYLRKAR